MDIKKRPDVMPGRMLKSRLQTLHIIVRVSF